jgi:large subunit ribosomal protein L21
VFAVVETGSKQYKVAPGQRLNVDKLAGEIDEEVVLEKVLMVVDGDKVSIGKPTVEGVTVRAKILDQTKGDKIRVFKYKPKKRYRRTTGFRSRLTTLQIESIEGI